ncbi:MAG: DUF4982 domain-containing protein, partial [Prevotella sp.]|nr:DUF4982 domain-containing protein [Prevotella sp.]
AVLHVDADWTRTAKTVNHSVNMKTTVFDADGNKVAEAVALDDFDETATSGQFNYQLDVTVPNVKLWYPWNLGDPYRYTVRTELFGMKQGDTQVKTLDVVEEKFGFRWIEFQEVDLNDRSTGGCFVNGKYTKLWGVNLHQDSGPLGSAGLYDAFERQMKILESMGCNYFRTSHAPISKAQVEVCSDLGFLVMEESFDSWGNPKAAWDFGIFFLDPVPTDWPGLIPNGYVGSNLSSYLGVNYPGAVFTWSDWVTQEFIRRDRNEPCIFLWSMGNEIRGTYWPTYSAADEENGVMPEWFDRIRKVPVWYDGTKYDNEAVTGLKNNTRNDGVETYKIVKTAPGVAAGTNETNGDIYTEMVRLSEDAKVADNTRVVMTTCDQLRSDPWVTKDNQPDDMWGHVFRYDRFIGGQYIYPGAAESLTKIFNPANGYEFAAFLETESNIMGTTRGNVYGSRNNFGPSSSVNGHKGGSGYCNHNSWFGGNTKANKKYYRDAPSALGVTFWVGMDYMGEASRINSNGAVDIAGFPKDYFYFYKALWIDKEDEKFAHLVPSEWSTWMPGEKIDVWVYTNVQSAELFLNGKSLGRKSFDIKETINGIQYYETSNHTNDDQSLTLIDKGDPFINTVNPGGYVSPAGTKIISASGDSEIAEGAPFGDTWLSWEDVVFEPGVLEVKCYDTPTSTEVVATDVLTTATNPYKVDMKAFGDRNVIPADGDSLIYVECDVVDEAGNPVYTADQNIEFYVSGAAAIVGTENGDNNQYDLYNRYYRVQFTSYSQHTAYGGKVLCILQSNGQEGDIQLIAKGDGLMPTVINFKATADGEGEAPAQTELAPEFVSADEPVFTVPTGVTPTLPTEIGVTYTDATIGTFTVGEAVVWDAVEASDSAKTFTVNGTAAGQPVKATVKVVKAEEKGDISTNTFQGSTLYEYASQGAANGYRFADFAEDSPVRDGALATSSFATGNPNAMLQANNSNWQNTFKGGGSNFVSNPITEIDTIPYSTVQFYWDGLKVFDSVDLTFVVSNPTDSASGTKIPAAFKAQYWDGNYWVDVENQEVALPEDTTSAGNKLVTVSFDAVLT